MEKYAEAVALSCRQLAQGFFKAHRRALRRNVDRKLLLSRGMSIPDDYEWLSEAAGAMRREPPGLAPRFQDVQ